MKENIDLTLNRDFHKFEIHSSKIFQIYSPSKRRNIKNLIKGFSKCPWNKKAIVNESELNNEIFFTGDREVRKEKLFYSQWQDGNHCDRCGKELHWKIENTLCERCDKRLEYEFNSRRDIVINSLL